ncbi:hypothetical protein G7059_03640 [Erysipelothrix sp. HDW6A]|uniref:hypothetical protein n=1 Tax=Erysipelothrix sp. HDW6A TaxID=2714928 RepID=UPI0014087774|nr:hypothetical protein [Erysipelothrix sp. HDW6A]QIK57004.1 hypothetical protein G7059_03640 [Erysipelothrix sp. HDW6A]
MTIEEVIALSFGGILTIASLIVVGILQYKRVEDMKRIQNSKTELQYSPVSLSMLEVIGFIFVVVMYLPISQITRSYESLIILMMILVVFVVGVLLILAISSIIKVKIWIQSNNKYFT